MDGKIKTFPIEMDERLHKALKFKALEADLTLHAYIIDVLANCVGVIGPNKDNPNIVSDLKEKA